MVQAHSVSLFSNNYNKYCDTFWHKLFPVFGNSVTHSSWRMFLGHCTWLHYLLEPVWDGSVSNGGFFSCFCAESAHLSLLRQDRTIASASNSLHSTMLSYLWGVSGGTVFLSSDRNSPFTADELSTAEIILQKTINKKWQLNKAISVALKNAIDYGIGYVTAIKGFIENVHPMFVVRGYSPNKREKFYIVDCGCHYWIFGKKGETSTLLNIRPTSKFFAQKIFVQAGSHTVIEEMAELIEDNVPMIFELELPYYKNFSDVPVGCGTMALGVAEKSACLAQDAYDSQRTELKPPVLVASLSGIEKNLQTTCGENFYYDSAMLGSTEAAKVALPARASSSGVFVEFWRQQVRQIYLLDQLVARSVGQTTTPDAARNASAASSVFEQMFDPFFRRFIDPLLSNFIKYHFKKELPDGLRGRFDKRVELRYVGAFTADIVNRDVQNMRLLLETISSLGQIDPTIPFVVNASETAFKVLNDSLPSSFFRTREEYDSIVRRAAQMAGGVREG